MNEDTKILAVAAFACLVLFSAFGVYRRRKHSLDQAASIEIAYIKEFPGTNAAAGICALLLIVFSAVSAFKYLSATTIFEQIEALLFWIGNCLFWGLFFIGCLITRDRASIVYRKERPPESPAP